MRFLMRIGLVLFVCAGCGLGNEGHDNDSRGEAELPELPTSDPRCQALCEAEEEVCASERDVCLLYCAAVIAGFSTSCSDCLLQGGTNVSCTSGGQNPNDPGSTDTSAVPCCPRVPVLPDPLGCASTCAREEGLAVSSDTDDPRCLDVCPNTIPGCDETSANACLAECQGRVEAATRLCGNCLIRRADSLECSGTEPGQPGATCCVGQFAIAFESQCDPLCY